MSRSKKNQNTVDSNVAIIDDELARIANAFDLEHPDVQSLHDDVDDTEAAMIAIAEDADVSEDSMVVLAAKLEELIAAGAERDSKSGRIRQLNRIGTPSSVIAKLLKCRYQQVFVTLKRAGLPNIRINVKRDEVALSDDDATE